MMNQTVEMSHGDKVEMYSMLEKQSLIEMLIQANNIIRQLTERPTITIYPNERTKDTK